LVVKARIALDFMTQERADEDRLLAKGEETALSGVRAVTAASRTRRCGPLKL
jgi:hypothetical protein